MNPSYRLLIQALFCLSLLQAGTASAFTIPELPPPEIPDIGEDVDVIDDTDVEKVLPGNVITDAGTLNTQVQPIVTALGTHIQGVHRLFAMPRGGGAGAGEGGFQGVWVNSSVTSFENDFRRTAFDGTNHLLLLGFDFSLGENHLLGVALSTEQSDIDTTFNNGNQEIDGTTIAPYYGWSISDNWSLDFSFGMSDLDIDQFRIPLVDTVTVTVVPGPVVSAGDLVVMGLAPAGVPITSSTSSEREFMMLNLNGFWTVGDWALGARLGHISTEHKQDGYTERGAGGLTIPGDTIELKQSYLGGDLAYGGNSQAFLSASLVKEDSSDKLVFDAGEQPANDEDGLLIAAGWRYYGEDGLSAVLEWTTREDIEEFSENSVSFTLRVDFD